MASQGYRDWLNAGQPYTLIRPARALVTALQGEGLTVFHYPDASHQKASTPEDHTPYSVTGYPGTNARWRARGVDIMPRGTSAAARAENANIARQLIRDREAGLPAVAWIKYINWTDEQGRCCQERWTTPGQPNRRTTRGSSDKGHIHVSGRSDLDNDARADGYNPVKRMNGQQQPESEGDDMAGSWTFVEQAPDDGWRLSQGSPGYAGQARDTALAFGWQSANEARDNTEQLLAAAAADETRDAAMLAAIKAISANGGPEVAPVVEAIRAAAAESRSSADLLLQRLAEVRQENHDLRARLAAALGPGSE